MVGGFLGAGKTTAILKMAQLLHDRGVRVGLITNDQSVGLVDTAILDSHGFPTAEITGGCFCCKFNSLVEAADNLTDQTQPDVFIAEPVGSCTDLKATVSFPLTRMYGDSYSIAPLSVLVDPIRAQRILGLQQGRVFSSKVQYIYDKQLEEADLIVINKTDLLSEDQLQELEAAIARRWPQARTIRMSARSGEGIVDWTESILAEDATRNTTMDVDYNLYAEGEALLGWLNLRAEVSGPEFDGNRFVLELARDLQQRVEAADAEIAHLKMTLTPEQGRDLAVANLVRGGGGAELSHELAEPLDEGELLLNLRAEGNPDMLRELVVESLRSLEATTRLEIIVRTLEAFRPGRPIPTHRLAQS